MTTNDERDVLEDNVSTLLEQGGPRPQIAPAAKARIRAELIARHGVARRPWRALALGVTAAVATALIVARLGDRTPPSPIPTPSPVAKILGAEIVRGPDAVITELGPRHVRVTGAALIDVEPGKGPFTVETPHGRIDVRGTRFVVDGAPDRTTAAVVRGEVVLATASGEVVLHAGEQAVAEPGHPPVRGPAPRLSHLASWAQEARHRAEQAPTVHHGTLFARDPQRSRPPWGEEYPLPIARLGVDVVVEDQVARVALDQTFHNDQPQTLEGVYRFAIPPDAALQRLAMYVDGRLVESGVVERMAARRIYEELVYRRVDPALLEWAGNGRLALRVYPIPGKQDKRLMLAYTQSLPALYQDYTLAIPLPEVDAPVGVLDVSVRVKDCAGCELSSTSHKIAVTRDGNDAVVRYQRAGETIGDAFVLRVRDARGGVRVTQAERDGATYLMVRAPVELGGQPVAYRPRTWVILDDVSASRDQLALQAQADVIDGLLHELDERDRVAVVAFDVEARTKLGLTQVIDVDRRAVRTALAREGGIGATDLGRGLDAAMPLLGNVAPDDAHVIYVGDGVITSGARNLDALRARLVGRAHFIGVGVGDAPDTQTLQGLAGATGGYATTIDLSDDVAWRTFDLVSALHTQRATDVTARLVDGQGAALGGQVYLGAPQLAEGEQLELVARATGRAAAAAVELRGMLDGQPWQQRIALPDAASRDAGYLPRLWAQRHIAARLLEKHEPVALPACDAKAKACPSEAEAREARDEAIRREVVALGKQYFLLSRHTSLLVLENDAMYAQYGVAKGTGETWAPYAMPPTIPVVTAVAPAPIVTDGELVRAPVPVFYGVDPSGPVRRRTADFVEAEAKAKPETSMASRGDVDRDDAQQARAEVAAPAEQPAASEVAGHRAMAERRLAQLGIASSNAIAQVSAQASATDKASDVVTVEAQARRLRASISDPFGMPDVGAVLSSVPQLATPIPTRFTQATDPSFDDLTGFVPALFPDAADGWRAHWTPGRHTIDPAAATLLAAARAALPVGIYRWNGAEIAVDAAHHFAWRRTTEAGLAETAVFDGATWRRRYPALGLEVARAYGADDAALGLAYFPPWIADPSHYAAAYDVSLRGPREVVLSRRVHDKPVVALVLAFDAQARLTSITGGDGAVLVELTWAAGLSAARLGGEPISAGFSAQPVADAAQWGSVADPLVTIDLPLRPVAYWDAQLAGAADRLHGQRQRLASLVASGQLAAVWPSYRALQPLGTLGDLVLASSGFAITPSASLGALGDTPIGRYLLAGRAYRTDDLTARTVTRQILSPPASLGPSFIRDLWHLRAAVAYASVARGKLAADEVLAIDTGAPQLQLIGAGVLFLHWPPSVDAVRVWDGVAAGAYRNIARAIAARWLVQRGEYEQAAARVTALIDDLDLSAPPPRLEGLSYAFSSSRRGAAGWTLAWSAWRDRVQAAGSYDHVVALIAAADTSIPAPSIDPMFDRAAALAGADVPRMIQLAQLAVRLGRSAWAEAHLRPLAAAHPSHDLHQLLATLALTQNRHADALADLEAAQVAAGDEPIDLAQLRREMSQIIQVAQTVAVQSSGAARLAAVTRALTWGDRWRAVDPSNPQIDRALGELLLSVGDPQAAWRQLSTMIERDPWSGAGYTAVADTLERQGKVAESLDYWQLAIVIDQTDPTPRLRKAQALFALGRNPEGAALLREITRRRWHANWEGVVYQAQALAADKRRE